MLMKYKCFLVPSFPHSQKHSPSTRITRVGLTFLYNALRLFPCTAQQYCSSPLKTLTYSPLSRLMPSFLLLFFDSANKVPHTIQVSANYSIGTLGPERINFQLTKKNLFWCQKKGHQRVLPSQRGQLSLHNLAKPCSLFQLSIWNSTLFSQEHGTTLHSKRSHFPVYFLFPSCTTSNIVYTTVR